MVYHLAVVYADMLDGALNPCLNWREELHYFNQTNLCVLADFHSQLHIWWRAGLGRPIENTEIGRCHCQAILWYWGCYLLGWT